MQDLRNRLLDGSRRFQGEYSRGHPRHFYAQAVRNRYTGSFGTSAMPSLRRCSVPQHMPDVRYFARERQNRRRHFTVHRLQALSNGLPFWRN